MSAVKKAKTAEFLKFDAADYLETEADIKAFIKAATAESVEIARDYPQDYESYLIETLAVIARAKNKTQLAKQIGVSRQNLYQILSPEGNPSFSNVLKLVHALGLKFTLSAVK